MDFPKSPFVIGVLQQKGGVGKTTLALNLAGFYAGQGARTLLVDADPQASAMAWSSVRETPPPFGVVQMATATLHRDLPDIARDYDVVIIDGAPRVNELARSAILASDFIIIPVQPSSFDYWAAQDTVDLIQEAQQFRPEIRAAFVVNRKIARTAISRAVTKAFRDAGFPLCEAAVSQRVSFAEAATAGATVFELEPKGAGAREIKQLGKEIEKIAQETPA